MREEYQKIFQILDLSVRLENLCEGFDEVNKSAILTSKIKVLIELSKDKFVTPSTLKNSVGLAKSNIAILCNSLAKEGLIEKKRDEFDTREISYSLTNKGEGHLNDYLKMAKKNFEGQLAYKDNMKQIETNVESLLELVK